MLNFPSFFKTQVGAYEIKQSLRFDGSSYMTRTPASNGSLSTWTYSTWVKYGDVAGSIVNTLISTKATVNPYGQLLIRADQALGFYQRNSGNTDSSWQKYSSNKLRDPSAWYHFLFVLNTGDSTVNNRQRMWINGVEVTSFSSDYKPGSADNSAINSTQEHMIGAYRSSSIAGYMKGYMAETHFVDGSALDPEDFGEYDNNGVWRPKRYTGSYGTNGFYLKFDPSATNGVGHDHSGNGNNFSPSGFDTTNSTAATYDVMSDTPTTNWCTLNAVDKNSGFTLSEGNLNAANTGAGKGSVRGTFGVTSGKWYWEGTCVNVGNGIAFGVLGPNADINAWSAISQGVVYVSAALKNINGTETSYGAAYANSDVIGVALNMDDDEITFYKNGTSQGVISGSLPDLCFPSFSDASAATAGGGLLNFGQRAFAYTPPTGFKALNTANLPAPTVKDGSQYFDTTLRGPTYLQQNATFTVNINSGKSAFYGESNWLTTTPNDPIWQASGWARARREEGINGYFDWYIPAYQELEVLYWNLKPTTEANTGGIYASGSNPYAVPSHGNYGSSPTQTTVSIFQEGGSEAFERRGYWASSGDPGDKNAFEIQYFSVGVQHQRPSMSGASIRVIRREAVTGSEPSIGEEYAGGYLGGYISVNQNSVATHAIIVAPKAEGELPSATMFSKAQETFANAMWWIKSRGGSNQHQLVDVVRGTTNVLKSPDTNAETTYTDPGETSVSWNWKANGTGSSNTDGSITSTVSANPSAGFSIVSYTGNNTDGATIGHGLGEKPSMIIVKERNGGSGWFVYHKSLGATKYLTLNATTAATPETGAGSWFFGTEPTSLVFTVGANGATNENNMPIVAYCFAEVEGYSKFGVYKGTNNIDNTFIYLGFKPAFFLLRNIDQVTNWNLHDSARYPYNTGQSPLLRPSATSIEGTYPLDFLSNGMKLRTAGTEGGHDNRNYIFAAFAEHPFGGANVSPATAR